jgi:tetratricopeptide (TPR) repeat protein
VVVVMAGTACSSVYQLSIEVWEPAPITFPETVKHILIVNNTAPQPGDVAVNRTYNGKPVTAYPLDLDSVSWTAIDALSETIRKARFFDNISLYKHRIRKDKEWMSFVPLLEVHKNELFDLQDFDAIISIDRLLFQVEEEVKDNTRESYRDYLHAFAGNRVEGTFSYSIHLRGETPSSSPFTVTDSLIYKNTLLLDSAEFFKVLPEAIVNELAYSLGEKSAYSLIPTWNVQERTIYTDSRARMQEAFGYAKNGRWEEAESLWLDLFNRESKNAGKAKIANNLAVVSEMRDKLEAALHWAEEAKKYSPAGSKEETFAGKYVSTLLQRMQTW